MDPRNGQWVLLCSIMLSESAARYFDRLFGMARMVSQAGWQTAGALSRRTVDSLL